jgi:hypothetical protein
MAGAAVAIDLTAPASGQDAAGPDWQGRLDWRVTQPVPSGMQLFYGEIVLKIERDGEGRLSGDAIGTQKQDLQLSVCPSSTVSPGELRGKLTGKYSGDSNTMTVDLHDVQFTPPSVTPCPFGMPGIGPSIHLYPGFEQIFGGLRPDGEDGAFVSVGQWTASTYTVNYNVNLRPVTRIVPRG